MNVNDVHFVNMVRNESAEFLHDTNKYTFEEANIWFQNNDIEFYILYVDEVRVGYFRTSNRTKKSIWIGLDIAVEHRGRGIAHPAYIKFIEYLKDIGIDRCYLAVLEHNTRAIHIYNKLGFKTIHTNFNAAHNCMDYKMMANIGDNIRNIVEYDTHFIIEQCYDVLFEYNNSTVFITGSDGFIGKWLYQIFRIMRSDYKMNIRIIVSDIDTPKISDVNPNDVFIKCDIINIDDVKEICHYIHPDSKLFIFNCAGIANPSSYMKNPIGTLDVSYIGTKNIIDIIAKKYRNLQNIALFSSSEIYGDIDVIPTSEENVGAISTTGNRACYDIGKLVLETLGNIYKEVYPIKIFRPFNLYGPFMEDTRIMPTFLKAIESDQPVTVYGSGLQSRTYCYAIDAMVMILKACIPTVKSGFYNIGNDIPEVSVNKLAKIMLNILPTKSVVNKIDYPDDYPHEEPMRRCPDITKIMKAVDYTPLISLETGIARTFEHNKQKKYDSII